MGLKEILGTFVLRFASSSLETGRDRVGVVEATQATEVTEVGYIDDVKTEDDSSWVVQKLRTRQSILHST